MDRIIIADTSCLIALTNIEKLHLLKSLYNNIIITKDVYEEFGSRLPEWIIVRESENKPKQGELEKILDKGEASSIALAIELENSILIIDENKGRNVAKSFNIEVIGTIGIILLAHKKGIITDVTGTILRLVNNGFRLSEDLINKILSTYAPK